MNTSRISVPTWRRYAAAVFFVIIMVVLRNSVLKTMGSQYMFAMYYSVVMATAWYGGAGPGALATLLAAAVAPMVGGAPRSIHWPTPREWFGMSLFVLNCSIICTIIESLLRTRWRLAESKESLEAQVAERTVELAAANERLKKEAEDHAKAAAQALATAEELREVKAAVTDRTIMAEMDANGVLLSVNERFCELLHYSREELVGQDYRSFSWEQDSNEDANGMWATLRSGTLWKGDHKVRTKTGEAAWVYATIFTAISEEAVQAPGRLIVTWVDITERKRAERALRQSEARYRAIGESLDYGVWICDAEGRNTYVSDSLLNLVGYTQEQFSNFGWHGVVHPDDADAAVAAWKECVKTGGTWEREFLFRGVDGRWHCILGRGSQVRDEEGNLCGWAGINVDITKLKDTERALRESEARYRAIGESLNYGVWLCEPDGRNVYASDSFLKLVGITQEQCSNFGWGEVLHPDDAEGTIAAWKECVQSVGMWDREHRFKGVDGKWHHILARGAPVKDAEGRLLGWAGINLDIDKLKATESALHESEAHMRNVLDSLFAFVGVMKADGTLTEVNRAVEEASGLPGPEIVGCKFWEAMWWAYAEEVEEQVRQGTERAMAGETVRFDVEAQVANGKFIWVDLTMTPMRDADGKMTHIIPSAMDITQRKRGEQLILSLNAELEDRVAMRTRELFEANKELREQFETIRRFEEQIVLATKREQVRIGQDLHDDLGQQLAGIWCFMRVVEKNLARQQSTEAENAARISDMLEKALATTRSLAHGLQPVSTEPQGLMSALATLSTRLSEMFNIQCTLHCPVPVLVEDNVRATHLYRITQESVHNAVNHGEARVVTIELTEDESHIFLIVRNNGSLLPTCEKSDKGMGLRIMRYRAGIIGGTLNIENTADGCVMVTCVVPRQVLTPTLSDSDHVLPSPALTA